MQYAKLIKYPFPPIKPEYTEYAEKLNKDRHRSWYRHKLYHAEILDGVLAITIFLYDKGKLTIEERHFYDGKKYATQRAKDNKRLEGSICYYLNYSTNYELDGADNIIKMYLKSSDETKKGISILNGIEQKMLDKKLEARHKKITDIVDKRMSAISENPPEEFFKWVDNWVLAQARYFFYWYRKGKKQIGYCSHCRKEYEADYVKHNAKTVCPFCGSELTCKALGKVTQYGIRDNTTVAYVQEITEDGKPTLVERIYNVMQDIEQHRQGPEAMKKSVLYYEERRIFLTADKLAPSFGTGKCNTFEYAYSIFKGRGSLRWCSITDCPYTASRADTEMWLYPGNINSIFKNSTIEKIRNIEVSAITCVFPKELMYLTKALTEMPVLENFAKLGLYNMLRLIGNKLTSVEYYGCEKGAFNFINSGCITVYKTLGISKDILKEMGDITGNEYLLYKRIEEISPIKLDTFKRYVSIGLCAENYSYTISSILKNCGISAEKLIGYFEKQQKNLKMEAEEILTFYNDYLSMVRELQLTKTESVLFPKNVKVEHDRLVKIKTDRKYDKQNKMLKKRVEILEMLSYKSKDFIIRPLRNAEEFLRESSILNHCVKIYIDRCAEGKINIFGIRRANAPDTPYFTLTLTNQAKVSQNLGKNNCYPPKEVKDFVKQWEKKVIAKNKQKFIEAANGKPQKVRVTA